MALVKIINRFEDKVAESADIGTFVFDDITAVNEDRGKKYPLCLLKPSYSIIDDITKPTGTLETYDLRMYIMAPFHQLERSHKTEAEKWNELKQIGLSLLREIQDRVEFKMIPGSVKCTPGHYQHNDDLMVILFEFKLSTHICNGS